MKPSARDTPGDEAFAAGLFWHRPTEVEKGAHWHAYTGERGASLCGTYLLMGCGFPKDTRRKIPPTTRCAICSDKWRAAQ